MAIPPEVQALGEVEQILAGLLGLSRGEIRRAEVLGIAEATDTVLQVGAYRFAVEWKRSSRTTSVAEAVRRLGRLPPGSLSKFSYIL